MLPDVVFDGGRHHRAKLGFVVLAMEQTIEEDMTHLAPPGVGIHFSRAPMANEVTAANLAAMVDGLADSAALILPDVGLDVVCYACTSGSVVMGEEVVRAELARGCPGAVPTTLVSGVFAALEALGARKVVVATPYLDEVNRIEVDYMEGLGYEILDLVGMGLTYDADMVRVTPDYIRDLAISVDRPDADAIFVSCGALRTVDVIDEIEEATGKPCVASNQAMLWHCLRLAGVDDRLEGLGRLFREH